MLNPEILWVFIPTFLFISITPGMCMTLALVLGMTVGVKRTLWMMLGELVGDGLVSVLAIIGVATLALQHPMFLKIFAYFGGAYLLYLGVQLWRDKGKLALSSKAAEKARLLSTRTLIIQGLITSVSNPKSWAFSIALFPKFIDSQASLTPQIIILVGLSLVIEFMCLLLYANGGQLLRNKLAQQSNVRMINRITGALLMMVAVWLVLDS